MKIIFSPSKGLDLSKTFDQGSKPTFFNKSLELVNSIAVLDKNELRSIFKIKKDDLFNEVYSYYKDFGKLNIKAIDMYNGVSFKKLEVDSYSSSEQKYLINNLRILSALYGVLKPDDLIHPYRLDFTMKIPDIKLYQYWKESILDYFLEEEIIINLASKEFSKLVSHNNMITIDFRQIKAGKTKSISSYTKQARGLFLNYMVRNNIDNIDKLKEFEIDNYAYSNVLSNDKEFIFIKTI